MRIYVISKRNLKRLGKSYLKQEENIYIYILFDGETENIDIFGDRAAAKDIKAAFRQLSPAGVFFEQINI